MNVLKNQYGRQLGMKIPVAIIGIILAIAIPSYMDHRVRERVSLALVENAAPVQYQVISFYQQHHRFPKSTEIKTGRLVQIGSAGIIQLSLDSVDKELQGSVLELVPTLEKGQLIWRCQYKGEGGKYIPSYCKKGEVIKPIQPLGPGESAEQKAVDWAAAVASLISATVGFSILALIFVGLFRLGFYLHWRIKSPTNRLVAYFHDNLDLTKPRILHSCLDKGADPNATDQFGRSLLYRAAIGCHADHMGPLLEHGADPNFRDIVEQNGDFVLTQALQGRGCSKDIIALLLEKGADPNAKGRKGQTPLGVAIEEGQETGVFQALIEYGADLQTPVKSGNPPLIEAAMADVEIGPFIDGGSDIHAVSTEGLIALWYAVENGNLGNIDRFLDHGAKLNINDDSGKNLVMLATEQYDLVTLRHLTNKGANLHALDKRGNSILMFGIYSEDQRYDIYGYYESEDTEDYPLTWLLKQGVDPNIRNADGETVLMRALSEGDERAVNALRAYGVVN